MSTTTISFNSALNRHYTGSLEQPDVITLFFKSSKDIEFYDENLINSIHYSPTKYFKNLTLTSERASIAIKKIFQASSSEDFGNAFKNLSRAIIQYIPLLGSSLLYIYDIAKSRFYIHPLVKAALAGESETVMGLAFDGKVVCKFSRDAFERLFSGQLKEHQAVFSYIWLSLLEENMQNSTKTRHQIATALANRIHNGPPR